MNNYWVDDKFVKKFEELQRAVGSSVSGSSNSKYNHYGDSNKETIQVVISSIVATPVEGAYTEHSTMQFVGREVIAADNSASTEGRLNFDSTIANKLDTVDQFDLGNLYGVNIEFDWEDPTADEDTYKDKTFNATRTSLKVKNALGEYEVQEVWSLQPIAVVSNFAELTITGNGDTYAEYKVDVKLGNPNLPQDGDAPKGLLFMSYGISDPIAVGAKLMGLTYASTEDVAEGAEPTYKYDCFPIETVYNLIAVPEEAP